MSSDQPYNSLGQILAAGGEIAVGLAITSGASASDIALLFRRRFEPMTDADRQELLRFAGTMAKAGGTITQLPPGSSIELGSIPLNANLFSGGTEGRRFLFTGEVEFEGLEHRVQIRLPFETLPTIDELREAAEREAHRRAYTGKGPFRAKASEDLGKASVYILLPERAF